MASLTTSKIIAFVFWAALISYSPLQAVEKPLNPVVYANAEGNFELFWFYPDKHTDTLGNIMYIPDRPGTIFSSSGAYALLSKFNLVPPIYIRSFMTYIMNQDLYPSMPGDQYTQIKMLLLSEIYPPQTLWSGWASLGQNIGYRSALVACTAAIAVEKSSEIWAIQQWQDAYPSAPPLGVTCSTYSVEQYYCPANAGYNDDIVCDEEFSVGLEILRWASEPTPCSTSTSQVSFRIQFAPNASEPEWLILDSLKGDSLRYSIGRLIEHGYARIVAYEGADSAASNAILLDSAKIPPISITPSKLDCIFRSDAVTYSFSFRLANQGNKFDSLELFYDSSIFSLDKNLAYLSMYEDFTLSFRPRPSDTILSSYIVIARHGQYYPLIYDITFRRDKPLNADGYSDNSRPVTIDIGEPFPNPFNNRVSFNIPSDCFGDLTFEVFNLLGQLIYSKHFDARRNRCVSWDGALMSGEEAPSGIYFFSFMLNNQTALKKAVYLK
jgi:hypothetical protein